MKWIISFLVLLVVLAVYVFVNQMIAKDGAIDFKGPSELPSVKGPGNRLPPNR